jgi:hypothetical protein
MFFGIPIALALALIFIDSGVRHYDVQERNDVQIELAKQNKHCIKFNTDNECIKEEILNNNITKEN